MLDIKEKRHIQIVGKGGGGQAESVDWNDIINKPEFATVATSGDYDDLTDKPTILTQWFGTQAEYDLIDPKDPNTIYNIEGGGQVQANWTENDSSDPSYIQNKPTLATVATSGSYNDLSNKPTIPSAQVNSDWNASSGVQQILNKPTLATVATSGSYNDLSNTPSLATVATSGSYNDLSDKPSIPTVPAMATETLTFTLQGGTVRTIEFYTVPNYFYIENLSDSNGRVSINPNSDNSYVPTFEVFYSTDRANWTSMGTTHWGGISTTIPANSKLYLKATTDKWGTFRNNDYYNSIICNVQYKVGGNIMSLLYGDNFEGATFNTTNNTYAFSNLFKNNSNLISAENLLLPATTLADECYQYMFDGCTALTTAPATLPATTLTVGCYSKMFNGCTALTTAPALPATTLAQNCYFNMFNGCTALTTAPALPATTLVLQCYMGMFNGCTALTTAPALPATTLANNCYVNMFKNCTSLTTAPALSSTTLFSSCYSNMFNGCTSLTTAPALPATTLANYCYNNMFQGCTNLNKVTTYAQDISASNCLTDWLSSVSAQGDFYNLGGATFQSGASGIPSGWTEHTSL